MLSEPMDPASSSPFAAPQFDRDALPQAVDALRSRRPVVVLGSRRGAFAMMSAAAVTPEWINFMASHARGLVGIALTRKRALELGLSLQPRRGPPDRPFFTQSVEARQGVSTGISAGDRWRTIQAVAFGDQSDIATPGHVFPQVPEDDPASHADLALALMHVAEIPHPAMLCTILSPHGQLAQEDEARAMALAHRLNSVTAFSA